jgi:hypothetical protein
MSDEEQSSETEGEQPADTSASTGEANYDGDGDYVPGDEDVVVGEAEVTEGE